MVKKGLVVTLVVLGIIGLGLVYLQTQLDTSYLARYIIWNQSEVEDKDKFPVRVIENRAPVFHYAQKLSPELFRTIDYTTKGGAGVRNAAFEKFLADNQTTSFIVIHDDAILYENYFNGYTRDSVVTSFSSAKSFASTLIGIAIDEGYITSVDDPVIKYLPELKGRGLDTLTIRHLLTMSTGIRFTHLELFGAHVDMPWDDNPRTYYDPNMRALALSVQASDEPLGQYFRYNNYHPLLLGLILERATGQTVAQYMQEKLWKPLGMEYPASWSLDSTGDGFEKMESGINARAIDFAKVGSLFLHNGNWNGEQLISEGWVREATTPDPGDTREWKVFAGNKAVGGYYKYMWWGTTNGKDEYDYRAAGKYGQYIYVNPRHNVVIVRYGKDEGDVAAWWDVFAQIAERVGGARD